MHQLVKKIVEETFKTFDIDRSGYLERKELEEFLKSTFLNDEYEEEKENDPQAFENRVQEYTDKLIENIDVNNDGKFSIDELKDLLEPLVLEILESNADIS